MSTLSDTHINKITNLKTILHVTSIERAISPEMVFGGRVVLYLDRELSKLGYRSIVAALIIIALIYVILILKKEKRKR